jgi:hypothetical protein
LTPDALIVNAAVRFSPADSIGVPVFKSGNSMYLPEMDADFNISSFLDFENEDGYEITLDVPMSYLNHLFRIGDPAPIIFWVKNASHIVEGDAEKAKLEEVFGLQARLHPVLRDLGEMLNDARTGKFKARQEERLAQELETSYGDVLLEPPSRTKYWISRYRAALENARLLTKPPHPIDVRLRRASTEWLARFGTKADLPMLGAILGEAAQGIYSVRQITEIMFGYISHRLTIATTAEITKLATNETIKALFNHGMYEFYVFEGWPHLPFGYSKPDFLEIMKERLVKGWERKSWKTALLLSELLFGDREAPRDVDDAALMYIREMIAEYNRASDIVRSNLSYRDLRLGGDDMTHYARIIVDRFQSINELSCIMHGGDRKRGAIMPGRFGVYGEDVDKHRKYLAS